MRSMANVKSNTQATGEATVPTVVFKAGPAVRQIQADISKATSSKDAALWLDARKRLSALKELISETTSMDNNLWDAVNASYNSAEDKAWANDIVRIHKPVDPNNPRGRKATEKVDPADLV